MELELKKLYKVTFPFTAVKAQLGQKHGYSFAAYTLIEEEAKIELDETFMVEENEILMVINVEKPPTRDRANLSENYQSEIDYTFLNSKGFAIQTLDPEIEINPGRYFREIIT